MTGPHAGRLPVRYLPAAYLESAPKLAGSLLAGAVYLFAPAVWPGAWAWLAVGPLIAVLVGEPVWRWTFTRIAITPTHLRVTTGAIHRREQSLAWADIGTVDSRQSWAFARWHLHALTLSQAGDERTKAQLWAADDELRAAVMRYAGHAVVDGGRGAAVGAGLAAAVDGGRGIVSAAGAETVGVLLYRVRIAHLLLASAVYGQFALIGGGAALAVSETLGAIGADEVIARWLPLPPASWALVIAAGIVTLGLVLTVVRYASFEVRRAPDDRLVISYGLLSTHERSIMPGAVIGVVLQRNLVETLLGRVRLSLLTTDSAAQLGTNLVLPSLPRRVVARLLREAFGEDPATRLPTVDRGGRALAAAIAVLASMAAVALLAGWTAAARGGPPVLVLASGVLALSLAWPVSRVLCARLQAEPGTRRVVLLLSHLVQRQIVLDTAAVHIVATSRLVGRPLLAHLSYYAGMPRTFRALRFVAADVDALSARVARSIPLARTRRRALRSTAGPLASAS